MADSDSIRTAEADVVQHPVVHGEQYPVVMFHPFPLVNPADKGFDTRPDPLIFMNKKRG